ncbi:N-acetylglucosamine-6-phosphate deacetylase [Alkalihalobacillus sp. 1P02AB]|uniref:N-acetylglucosamine-6-phosphate deacetylase n=1 Tax=Alkalihalobacillus sp. 1P02AB TaxID=3132260 RepID=UPI0039A4F5B5
MTYSYTLTGAKMITEEGLFHNGSLTVTDRKITAISTEDSSKATDQIKEINLPANATILPGFIDLHIHGANGSDTMDATPNDLQKIAQTIIKEGTTSFLATTITQDPTNIKNALQNVAATVQSDKNIDGAKIVGIHLEGPFISAPRAGAQPLQHIQKPTITQFQEWLEDSKQLIKLVTYAPEEEGGIDFTTFLHDKGIVASIGHSDATFAQVKEAIEAGATHVTHLYNGMRGFHHREPGVAGTALSSPDLFVELIVDGIHVHPDIVKTTYYAKSADKIVLITDSIRAKWLEEGLYDLGGQQVRYADGKALLENGSLAGSVLKMNDAVKNMIQFSGCTLEEASIMASQNPAKQIGIFEHKGSIALGKDADLTVLDENYEVLLTICEGKIVYDKRGVVNENR